MNGIPVRYNAVFGIGILLGGAFVLLSGLLLGKVLLLLIGVVNTLAGFGFTTQPWFVVFSDRIEIRNMIGMTLKTHRIQGLADLEVHGGRVWSKRSNAGFSGLGGWLARGRDIDAVRTAIRRADETVGRLAP